MPYHKDFDGSRREAPGREQDRHHEARHRPCYQDKVARKGIRIQDLLDEKIFRLKLEAVLSQKNPILEKIYGLHTYTVEEICESTCPMRASSSRTWPRRPAAERGRARRQVHPVRGRAGHVTRHRPRHVPLRHVLVVLRRRRRHGHGQGPHGHRSRTGHPEGLSRAWAKAPSPRSSASPRTAAKARRPRSASCCARWATSSA